MDDIVIVTEETIEIVSVGIQGPQGPQGPEGPPGAISGADNLPDFTLIFENGLV